MENKVGVWDWDLAKFREGKLKKKTPCILPILYYYQTIRYETMRL